MFFEVYTALCQSRGISPTKASQEMGFSKGSVSYWRKNYNRGKDAKPDIHTAQKMADYFGVSVDFLLGRRETQKTTSTGLLRDGASVPSGDEQALSFEEQMIIDAYRHNPQVRDLINQALGVRKLEPKK